jgi:hypothetical protein
VGEELMEEKIKIIRKLLLGANLNSDGIVYEHALEKSAEMFGDEGLRHQVLYILANSRFSNRVARKVLEKYGTGKKNLPNDGEIK